MTIANMCDVYEGIKIYQHGGSCFVLSDYKQVKNPLNGYLFRVTRLELPNAQRSQGWRVTGISMENQQMDVDFLDSASISQSVRNALLLVGEFHTQALFSSSMQTSAENAKLTIKGTEELHADTAQIRASNAQLRARIDELKKPWSFTGACSNFFGAFWPVSSSQISQSLETAESQSSVINHSEPRYKISALPSHIHVYRRSIDELEIMDIEATNANNEKVTFSKNIYELNRMYPTGLPRLLNLELTQHEKMVEENIEIINRHLERQNIFFKRPEPTDIQEMSGFPSLASLDEEDRELVRMFQEWGIPWSQNDPQFFAEPLLALEDAAKNSVEEPQGGHSNLFSKVIGFLPLVARTVISAICHGIYLFIGLFRKNL